MVSCHTSTNEDVRKKTIQLAEINDLGKPVIFDTLTNFTIISLIKTSDYPSSADDTLMCINWSLSKEQARTIIRSAQVINGHQWHYLFSHLPCQAIGKIIQNGQTFEYAINSGSWITIGNQDSTIILGVFNEGLEGLFLDSVWKEEDEY